MSSIYSFQWRPSLLIHVPLIDQQHREYFNRVNRLFAASHDKERAFQSAIDFLRDYVVLHFDTEERVMTFHDYPDIDRHLAQHEFFIEQFEDLRFAVSKSGASPELMDDFQNLLVEWFVKHISKVDTKLGNFLQDRPMPE